MGDIITVTMEFEIKPNKSGIGPQKSIWMTGKAGPRCSSGSNFGMVELIRKDGVDIKARINHLIEEEVKWLKNFYPERDVKIKYTVQGLQKQTTFADMI